MKKFLQEFKKFITRGNVMDMAVGTIVGAAFTAIPDVAKIHRALAKIANFFILIPLYNKSSNFSANSFFAL